MSQVDELLTETRKTLVDPATDVSEYMVDADEYPRYLTVFHSLYVSKTTNSRRE
jgi:hypothetical protein